METVADKLGLVTGRRPHVILSKYLGKIPHGKMNLLKLPKYSGLNTLDRLILLHVFRVMDTDDFLALTPLALRYYEKLFNYQGTDWLHKQFDQDELFVCPFYVEEKKFMRFSEISTFRHGWYGNKRYLPSVDYRPVIDIENSRGEEYLKKRDTMMLANLLYENAAICATFISEIGPNASRNYEKFWQIFSNWNDVVNRENEKYRLEIKELIHWPDWEKDDWKDPRVPNLLPIA